MLPLALVLGVSLAYLLLLFAVAAWADRRASTGRPVTRTAWIYTQSLGGYGYDDVHMARTQADAISTKPGTVRCFLASGRTDSG